MVDNALIEQIETNVYEKARKGIELTEEEYFLYSIAMLWTPERIRRCVFMGSEEHFCDAMKNNFYTYFKRLGLLDKVKEVQGID